MSPALLLAAPAPGAGQALPERLEAVSDGAQTLAERVDRQKKERRKAPPAPSLPKDFRPLPLVEQTTNYSCGPAALCSVMNYWDVYKGSETGLHQALDTTPEHGTHPVKIVEVARKHGLKAELKEEVDLADLRAALRRGQTVILNVQAWRKEEDEEKPWRELWEYGHYLVLVGLDRHYVYVMDSLTEGAYGYIPLAEFKERWHDYEDRTGTRREYHRAAIFIRGRGRGPERGEAPKLERIE